MYRVISDSMIMNDYDDWWWVKHSVYKWHYCCYHYRQHYHHHYLLQIIIMTITIDGDNIAVILVAITTIMTGDNSDDQVRYYRESNSNWNFRNMWGSLFSVIIFSTVSLCLSCALNDAMCNVWISWILNLWIKCFACNIM